MNEKIAVIYARYSSAGQTEQSIEGQVRVCKEYAERKGYTVIHEYIDRATTGTNTNRPAFLQMVSEAQEKTFSTILVYKLDRFARNKYDSVVYKHKLQQYGVSVESATEAISNTAEGKLVEGLLEMMAEMYSTDLSQKVKRGRRESAIKGNFTGGHILYGYKVNNKKITIDEEKAPIVRFIFEKYADGVSKKEIVKMLNEKGYKNYYGQSFSIKNLHNLNNEKYIGICKIGETISENTYPPLISKDLFEKVQEKLKEHKHSPGRNKAKHTYLLSGKIYCGLCGETVVGVSGTSRNATTHYYYTCYNRWKTHNCTKTNEKQEQLEDFVIKTTHYKLNQKETIETIASGLVEFYKNHLGQQQIDQYEKIIDSTNKKIDKCFSLMLKTDSDEVVARLNNEIKSLELQKKDLSVELKKLKLANNLGHSKEDIIEQIKLFVSGDITDVAYRKRLIDKFVNSIWIFDNSQYAIYFNIFDNPKLTFEDIKNNLGVGSNFNNLAPPKYLKCEHNIKIVFVKSIFGLVVRKS